MYMYMYTLYYVVLVLDYNVQYSTHAIRMLSVSGWWVYPGIGSIILQDSLSQLTCIIACPCFYKYIYVNQSSIEHLQCTPRAHCTLCVSCIDLSCTSTTLQENTSSFYTVDTFMWILFLARPSVADGIAVLKATCTCNCCFLLAGLEDGQSLPQWQVALHHYCGSFLVHYLFASSLIAQVPQEVLSTDQLLSKCMYINFSRSLF